MDRIYNSTYKYTYLAKQLASVFVVGEVFPELLLVLVHLLLVLLEHPVDDEKGEEERPLRLNPGKLLETDLESLYLRHLGL